jgi:hypothetical protein
MRWRIVWLTCEFLVQLCNDLCTSLRVNLAKNGIDLVLYPVTAFFGLRRSNMQENRESTDLPEQLQKLRLPVFQRVRPLPSISFPRW